jgi:peptidoglycan/xylan/chitin deacetylase (PgdA/CDA1 family)
MKQTSTSFFYNILSGVWPTKDAPRAIYYHSIHASLPRSQHPEEFERQISWLRERDYAFFTFSDLLASSMKGKLSPKSVAITFDDGYLDNYEYALPILLAHDVPATFFVVSGLVGEKPLSTDKSNKLYRDRYIMTKGQLHEMGQLGMEIGSHTASHIHVRRTLTLSSDKAAQELLQSRKALESIVKQPVVTFAYPNGQKGVFDTITKQLLIESGYRYAATTIWGYIGHRCDLLQVPRIEIKSDDSIETFSAKISGKYDFLRWLHYLRDGSRKW